MIVDIVVITVLLISAIIAFFRGLIREILTILGVVGGLAASYGVGPALVPLVQGWLGVKEGAEPQKLLGVVPYPLVADIIAYGSVFLVVVIVLSVVSHFISAAVKSIGLGAIDRTLGVLFGVVRGVLLLSLLYWPIYKFLEQDDKDKWFDGSRTYFYLEKTTEALIQILPSDSVDAMMEKAQEGASEAMGAREKLEDMDLLKQKEGSEPSPKQEPAADDDKAGYSNDFRSQMDNLFEEGATP